MFLNFNERCIPTKCDQCTAFCEHGLWHLLVGSKFGLIKIVAGEIFVPKTAGVLRGHVRNESCVTVKL